MRKQKFQYRGKPVLQEGSRDPEKAERGILPSRASERSVNVRSPAREPTILKASGVSPPFFFLTQRSNYIINRKSDQRRSCACVAALRRTQALCA